jgi:hypothetical protein
MMTMRLDFLGLLESSLLNPAAFHSSLLNLWTAWILFRKFWRFIDLFWYNLDTYGRKQALFKFGTRTWL